MDRRTLLSLAACLPAFVSTQGGACSFAPKNPRSSGLQNEQVRKLFEAWWQRDLAEYRKIISKTLMDDGSPMAPDIAKELSKLDAPNPEIFEIFNRFFTDRTKLNRLTLIVNTDAAIVVACSEADVAINIQPDCSGLPKLHLFAIGMSGVNPRSITHIASVETAEVDKFSIWTEGSH